MAAEKGLSVDEEGFRRLMTEQRERARADARSKKGKQAVAGRLPRHRRHASATPSTSPATPRWSARAPSAASSATTPRSSPPGRASEIELVLDRTPFYAEGGGQLADQGVIELDNGARIEVYDVQSPITGLIVHKARVLEGEVSVGGHAQALVDVERRALDQPLAHRDPHGAQGVPRGARARPRPRPGRRTRPGRFRFDFSATGAVPASAMADVEARVNDLVIADLGVHAEVMTQEEAVRSGAMALFGEKYGDQVRVISVGDWARELCGGTHAAALRPARRGQAARRELDRLRRTPGRGARRRRRLPVPRPRAPARRAAQRGAQGAPRAAARAGQRHRRPAAHGREGDREGPAPAAARRRRDSSWPQAEDVDGVSFVGHEAPGAGGGDVRTLALDIRGRMPGRPAGRGRDRRLRQRQAVGGRGRQRRGARSAGISANTLVRAASEVLGGKGGGKDDVAQGGGADASKAGEALAAIRRALAEGRPLVRRWRPSWPAYASAWTPATPASGSRAAIPPASWPRPVETVPRGAGDLDRLAALVEELGAVRVYVGLPRSLSGRRGTLGR